MLQHLQTKAPMICNYGYKYSSLNGKNILCDC